jgi:hypothetical protein
MMNMKTLRYIFLLVLVIGTTVSCFDDEALYELNDDGPSMVGFKDGITAVGGVADGNEYSFVLPMKVLGPGLRDLKSAVTATIAVDESSTAIEGTHFRLDNTSITLDPNNNFLGNLGFTMLTEGIVAPLAVSPIVVFRVESVTGDAGVIESGKTISVTLNYGCFSNLAGTYSLVVTRTNYDGAVTTYPALEDEITAVAGKAGEYHTSWVGHYFPGGAGPLGAPAVEGFVFADVCNQLSVPLQQLGDYYSNEVSGIATGNVDPETGIITLYYQITFAAGIRTYESVYTPIP